MVATFNPNLSTPKDRIRQRIGDADASQAQIQDETIEAYLTTHEGEPQVELRVAYQLAIDLAAKWARFGTTTLDDQQQRSENIYKSYLALAATLKAELNLGSAGPGSLGLITVGGIGDCRGPIDCDPDYRFVVRIPQSGP